MSIPTNFRISLRLRTLFLIAFMGIICCSASAHPTTPPTSATPTLGDSTRVIVGAERTETYLPLLQGKRVALLSNHTGMVGAVHTLDLLLSHGVQVTAIFSPEHGFRGTAREGEHVQSSVDEKTGIPILSLYDGKSYRPSAESMALFDVLITDIQDVGLRFYTYYITMMRLMDACAHENKAFIVFDRPNPNGYYVDGPILDMRYRSGVGALPIPIVHGMTLGELARMINGEYWLSDSLQVPLTVITCLNYTHQTLYRLPVPPSPNLRNMLAIYLYPSVCLFEGTPISLGRGTDLPFLCYGHPAYHSATAQDTISFTPTASTQRGNLCHGINLSQMPEADARSVHFSLRYLIDAYNVVRTNSDTIGNTAWDGNAFFTPFFEKLVGVDYIRPMILSGYSEEDIRTRWQDDVRLFCEQRKPYLLYEE